jgi:voltage-gated potassium channel
VIATFVATMRLLRAIGRALGDPAARGIVVLALGTLSLGTVFYVNAEGWRWLDALYFSVVTLTTIGYGDLVPVTDGGKVFTIVYSLVGIGIIAAFVTSLAVSVRDDHDRRRSSPDARSPRRRRGAARRRAP